VVAGAPPFGKWNRLAVDRAKETDKATFGHWATVMPPVRRLTNIHRTPRRNFEERPICAIASSGVIKVTASTAVTARQVQPHLARRNRLYNSSVRRTGLDSIPESTLEANGWLDFEHKQEKTLGRRGQLLELGSAAWAGGEMVEQCHLFLSVEYPSRQLGEVCFKSLV